MQAPLIAAGLLQFAFPGYAQSESQLSAERRGGFLPAEEEQILPTNAPASLVRKPTPVEKLEARNRKMAENPVYFKPGPAHMPPQPFGAPPPAGPPLNATTYTDDGPGPANFGQSENVSPNNQVVGACNSVTCHPTNASIIYAGMVNGGIWKTTNGTNAAPTWTVQTDNIGSLSIGSIEFDPTDATHNTLVAGIARTSSLASLGGSRIGVIRTTDGGTNWTVVGSASMAGKNVIGVAPRGSTIVAAVNYSDANTYNTIGIFRSTNTGSTFTQISNGSGTAINANGLPGGRATDLQRDPTNNAVLYTAFMTADLNNGVYKSTDTGATWSRVSNATMNTLADGATNNIELSVGASNNVYAAIVRSGRLAGVFRSGDGGVNWTQMDLPGTVETATFHGIHPGGQGSIHLSIVADPSNANIVYVGGDRQPGQGDAGSAFPNSIGAGDYSGRLFRGDASQSTGNQWKPLTHSNSVAAFPGGGTASSSAPHADSRDMAIDVNGRIIQGDDGGVWARTNPQNNTGNWFSLVSNLKATEIHDIAYDNLSNKIIVGTQDNGTIAQTSAGNWQNIMGGDGGDVAVDNVTLAGSNQSIRYKSFQHLQGFTRWVYNSSGNLVTWNYCNLAGASPTIQAQFVTPVELNKVAPHRMAVGAFNGVYESLDQGATCSQVTTARAGDGTNGGGIAYGGKQGGVDNPDVMYVCQSSNIHVRTTAGGAFTSVAVPTGGEVLTDIVMDPSDYATAYAVSNTRVFRTTNTGASWSEITGSGGSGLVGVGQLRCIEFVPTANGGTIVVGGQTGVYVAKATDPTVWFRLGTNMPVAAYVYDIVYDATDDVLVAGTLGRSVWRMTDAAVAASVPVTMSSWEVF